MPVSVAPRPTSAPPGSWPRPVTGGDPLSPHASDVVNLAGLLYAALVGRWPGTEGSTIPSAPSEHARPLRPRQVRAGVPRPLDAICDRALGGGSHHQQAPIETAHEIFAALSDYLGDHPGDPVGNPLRSLTEPTTAWDATAVGGPAEPADPAVDRPDTDHGTDWDVDTGHLPATGAQPTSGGEGRVPSTDPEATQAVSVPPHAGGDGSTPRPRPLFAEGPTAATPRPQSTTPDSGSFTGEQRSTGAGNGRLPASWGPDPEPGQRGPDDDWDTGGHDRTVPGRTWLRLAVVLGVLVSLVVAVVLAFTIGRGGSDAEPTPAGQSAAGASSKATGRATAPVAIAGVRDFDPQGNPPEENPDLAPLATDGDLGTAWRTSTYYDPLEKQKSGVGLLVDLGRPTPVGEVRVILMGTPTPGRPATLEILAAPGAATAPTSTDGLATVATDDDAGNRVALALSKDVTTRWVVVWFTRLPTVPGGFQGRVAEISVRS